MRAWRSALGALVCLGALALAPAQELPDITWAPLRDSIARADRALRSGQYREALARLDAIVFPEGIRVGLDEGSLPPGRVVEARQACERALAIWMHLLGPGQPLRWEARQARPEVTIRFVEALPACAHDALGYIDLKQDLRWSRSAHRVSVTGTIYVLSDFEGRPLSFGELVHVLMHEVGHLVGLEDVENPDYLMGPLLVGRPLAAPTRYEVDAVLALRTSLNARRARALAGLKAPP